MTSVSRPRTTATAALGVRPFVRKSVLSESMRAMSAARGTWGSCAAAALAWNALAAARTRAVAKVFFMPKLAPASRDPQSLHAAADQYPDQHDHQDEREYVATISESPTPASVAVIA